LLSKGITMVKRVGLLLVLLVGAACSSSVPPPPTPALPLPTPAPALRPAPTSAPTLVSTPIPAPTPTPQFLNLEERIPYIHPTGVFSIEVPLDWSMQENSVTGTFNVIWTDPGETGAMVVDLYKMPESLSPEELIHYLQDYLLRQGGDETEVLLEEPVPREDGSVRMGWSLVSTLPDGTALDWNIRGISLAEQHDDVVALLTIGVPQEQYDTLFEPMNAVVASFGVDSMVEFEHLSGVDHPSLAMLEGVEFGELESYTDPSGRFALDVPSAWEQREAGPPEQPLVFWTDQTGNGTLAVMLVAVPAELKVEELTQALQTFIREGVGANPEFSMQSPTLQGGESVRISWSYAEELSGIKDMMQGESIIKQRGQSVALLTIGVPQWQFDSVEEQINAIIASYTILAPVDE
jgi:hypothetical protein